MPEGESKNPFARVSWRALSIAVIAGTSLIAAGACGTGCENDIDCDGIIDSVDHNPQVADFFDVDLDGAPNAEDLTPYGPPCFLDQDCDGITDGVDRTPYSADVADVDRDGVLNAQDINPYGSSQIVLPLVIPKPNANNTVPAQQSTGGLACIYGLTPDGDGDGIPDYCDSYFDFNNKDSDSDGIPDTMDPDPFDYDRDNDGIPDGADTQPDVNQKLDQQKQQDRRSQELRDAQRAQERRQQDQRDEYRREQQRLQDEYQRTHR